MTGFRSKLARGNRIAAPIATTRLTPTTARGLRSTGLKMRTLHQAPADATPLRGKNCASNAGSNVTLTNRLINMPVPDINPSSDTPENAVGMNE